MSHGGTILVGTAVQTLQEKKSSLIFRYRYCCSLLLFCQVQCRGIHELGG